MAEFESNILRATHDDSEDLSRLSTALFPLGCPVDTPAEDLLAFTSRELTAERFSAFIDDTSNAILVARVSKQLAGFAMIARAPAPSSSRADVELRKFYIDPAFHGTGLANALMKEALEIPEAASTAGIWLSVFSGNGRAIAFYQRWGFRIIGAQTFMVGKDHQRDYLMENDSLARLGTEQSL
jgi:ribosomal protein S18 acetylase RimI-like enzyme